MIADSDQDPAVIADMRNPPVLPAHLQFYMNAFWDLACFDGIRFSELDAYAARYGVDGLDHFHRFKTLVTRLNSKWVEMTRAAMTKDAD